MHTRLLPSSMCAYKASPASPPGDGCISISTFCEMLGILPRKEPGSVQCFSVFGEKQNHTEGSWWDRHAGCRQSAWTVCRPAHLNWRSVAAHLQRGAGLSGVYQVSKTDNTRFAQGLIQPTPTSIVTAAAVQLQDPVNLYTFTILRLLHLTPCATSPRTGCGELFILKRAPEPYALVRKP